jgi:ubiquinone/menaquinone biosynthesis C-methylase UbiE
MDYDKTNIPAGYDRGRDLAPDVIDIWMRALAAHVQGMSITGILDLGCGTGRFSEPLAAYFNAQVVGIDPSEKMLERAREKRRDDRVEYRLAPAEALPLPSASVDIIFMSMSFHHFRDRLAAARECRRVLRQGGTLFVRTGTREQIPSYPYVPFFQSTAALIEETLPDRSGHCQPFEAAGFRLKAADLVTQTIAPDWDTYADRLAAGGDSILSRLSPEEFESGLAAVRRHAREAAGQEITEPIDLFVFC